MSEQNETPEVVGDKGDTVTVQTLGDQLQSEMPPVSENAIDAEQRKTDEVKHQWSHLKDRLGQAFDPKMHVTDNDGSPKLTSAGNLRRKRGIGTSPRPQSTLGTAGSPSGLTPQEETQARQGGLAAAQLTVQTCVLLLGDEWQPIRNEQYGVDELGNMEKAYGDYFVAKGFKDISPGWALAIALTGYALPRFRQPQTQSRWQLTKAWVKDKWAQRKARRENGAQSDSGNNGKRKDDPRKTTGETVSDKGDKGTDA